MKGLCISCDLNALATSRAYEINHVDFMRRTSQLVAYRPEVVLSDFDTSIITNVHR